MRSADIGRAAALMLLAAVAVTVSAAEPKSNKADYNKVDTFEPGRKYNCVPTADRKGWDCSETGKSGKQDDKPATSTGAAKATPLESAPAPVMPAAAAPAPVAPAAPPTTSAPTTSAPTTSAPTTPPPAAATPAPTNARPPAGSTKGSSLPSYLRVAPSQPSVAPSPASTPVTAPESAATERPAQSARAGAAAPPAPPAREVSPAPTPTAEPPHATTRSPPSEPTPPSAPPEPAAPAVKAKAAPERAETATPTTAQPVAPPPPPVQPKPVAAPARAEAPAPRQPAAAGTEPAPAAPAERAAASAPAPPRNAANATPRGNREFSALPGSAYVVELAHSARKADLASLRESLALTHGDLYELHLRRDGNDWWLLVWGTFDSVDSARSARNEIPADAALNAGWPRRVAVLQAEARQAGP